MRIVRRKRDDTTLLFILNLTPGHTIFVSNRSQGQPCAAREELDHLTSVSFGRLEKAQSASDTREDTSDNGQGSTVVMRHLVE